MRLSDLFGLTFDRVGWLSPFFSKDFFFLCSFVACLDFESLIFFFPDHSNDWFLITMLWHTNGNVSENWMATL